MYIQCLEKCYGVSLNAKANFSHFFAIDTDADEQKQRKFLSLLNILKYDYIIRVGKSEPVFLNKTSESAVFAPISIRNFYHSFVRSFFFNRNTISIKCYI